MDQLQLFETIAKSAGLAVAVLVLICLFMVRLYTQERTDRREAWKSHNELARETNKVLRDLTLVMESMKQEVFRKGK